MFSCSGMNDTSPSGWQLFTSRELRNLFTFFVLKVLTPCFLKLSFFHRNVAVLERPLIYGKKYLLSMFST
jgi:hypothetical protein